MKIKVLETAGKTTMKVVKKVGFKLNKVSPEICLVGGVLLVGTGTVLACKATKHAEGIMDEANAVLGKINDEKSELDSLEKDIEKVDVTHEELAVQRKELTRDKVSLIAHTGGKLLKVYAPAVAAESLGIALIFVSHGIMKKRNAALIGAYNALDGAFRRYRDRVRDSYGEDVENRIRNGLVVREIEDESGDEKAEKSHYIDPTEAQTDNPDVYVFNPFTSRFWSSEPMVNLNTLRQAENWATDQLRLQGHLFVNELLDYLGMDRTSDGQIRGWEYDPKGDNYTNSVNLGLYDDGQYESWLVDRDVLKRGIWITLNTHGLIWDRI